MKLAIVCSLMVAALTAPMFAQVNTTPAPPAAAQTQAKLPFESEILAFEAADKKNPPAPGGVMFVGSSSIRFWTTLAQDFPELPVLNRGFGGSEIADSIRYADRIVIPYKPRLVVLYAGTNDLNGGKSPVQVLKDFRAFVGKIHAALPDTRIAYISINPSVARWKQEANILEANRLIQKFIQETASKTLKLTYLDSHARLLSAEGKPQPDILRPDGLHLNARGYMEWTAILHPQIVTLWKDTAG